MLAAFSVSVLFLVGYVAHKVHLHNTTGSWNTTFSGPASVRGAYLGILASHVLAAAIVPFLATVTLVRGLRMDVANHRRIARITFPVWMYASVSGVVVYLMLYQWFAQV